MHQPDRNLLWNRINAYVEASDGYPMYLPIINPSPEVERIEQAVEQIAERLYREKCPGLGLNAPLEKELADAKAEIARLTHNLVQTERTLQILEKSLADGRAELSCLMGERNEARRWMLRLTDARSLPDLTAEKDTLLQEVERLRAEVAQLKDLVVDREKTSAEVTQEQGKRVQEALSDLEDARAEAERLEKLCGERTHARDAALAEAASLKADLANINKVIMKSADDWDKRLKRLERERDEAKEAVEIARQHVCLTDIGCGECHLCQTILAGEQLSRELAGVREFLNGKGVPWEIDGVALSTVDRLRVVFKSQETLVRLLPDVEAALSALTKISKGMGE